jgi:hypothetical protein
MNEQEKAILDSYKTEAERKHKGSFCLGCIEQDYAFYPHPCKGRQRWQTEGFCTKKQRAETKAKASVANESTKEKQ